MVVDVVSVQEEQLVRAIGMDGWREECMANAWTVPGSGVLRESGKGARGQLVYHYKYYDVTGVSFKNDGKSKQATRERRIKIIGYGERDGWTTVRRVGTRGQLV